MKGVLLALLLALPGSVRPASAAGGDLSSIQIFPIPWKPGSGDAAFDSAAVTFTNLPPGTHVTVFTLRGQRVWNDRADATGTLLWRGQSDHGDRVASAVYIALFDAGGRRATRRVVVIR